MRRTAVFVFAAVAGVLSFLTLAWPFELGLHHESPYVHSTARCSPPIVQLVDPPRPGPLQIIDPPSDVPDASLRYVHPNLQPRCREVGRSRAAAGLALFSTGTALLLLFRALPERARSTDPHVEVPAAVV